MSARIRSRSIPQEPPINRMIKAYPAAHGCEIVASGARLGGILIDINHASARIRLHGPDNLHTIRLDQVATLNTFVGTSRRALNGLRCRIAWISGWEVGVEFDDHLGVGILELQAAFDVRRAA